MPSKHPDGLVVTQIGSHREKSSRVARMRSKGRRMRLKSLTFATGAGDTNARIRIKEKREKNHKNMGEFNGVIEDVT